MRSAATMTALMASLALPTSASAQSMDAPGYYLDGLFALAAAENVARFCPTLEINLQATSALTTGLLARLGEDGVTPADISSLNGVEDGFAARQAAFLAAHDLDGAEVETVCAAGVAEITQASEIGRLMVIGTEEN